MMAEGRFASLPRSLHAHHALSGGTAHHGMGNPSLGTPSSSNYSSRGLQASLASSMDLISSRNGSGQGSSLSDLPAASYQPVSIHGTLPRRRRGSANANPAPAHYTWDPRANQMSQSTARHNTSVAAGHVRQPMSSPLAHNGSDNFQNYREPSAGLDTTVDYVKFSRDQFIMDCSSEKLHRELEEELKMSSEEPRSHAWYHGAIPRQVAENLVQRDGDFLLRDSLSSPGCYVLTCQWRNVAQHFKITKQVVTLNEAYSRVEYRLEREGFDSVPALIRYYVGNRKPVSQVVGAIIFQPINRALPLRCLEEKYGLVGNHREAGQAEKRNQKRFSLNITNGHSHDNTHTHHDHTHIQDSRGNQLRLKDRCGSQPASLNQVQERRRPLKTHQSESFLPLGSRSQPQHPDTLLPSPGPKSPVFRTGSEPVLSPTFPRRSTEPLAGQAIRGSDSQLCPKPPPKPSKVPMLRLPLSLHLQPQDHLSSSSSPSTGLTAPPLESTSCVWRNGASMAPPAPPAKPLKFQHQLQIPQSPMMMTTAVCPASMDQQLPDSNRDAEHSDSQPPSPAPLSPHSQEWEEPIRAVLDHTPNCQDTHTHDLQPQSCSYVERLRREEGLEGDAEREEDNNVEGSGRRALDRSSYHHAIAALENSEGEEEDGGGREEEQEKRRREKERTAAFRCPVFETESAFRPSDFGSRLLPPENKPLEMVVLKRAKELLLDHNHHSIARHLLMADCLVARILGVSEEVKEQMGVASGLELVTLPHGQQLRLDLLERHHTMAIGVAVDILGCTGSVEERASTLNRIILVAMELKDAVGDLYAFTALMKALDLPQINRLEQTWTALRRSYTQTAINYEKTLKPFYKSLYEGTASLPPVVCVPLLLPLLALMERPSITPEGAELWETSEQGCDIMLRHLQAARGVAHNAHSYTANAQTALQGFQCDEDLLEVFKTDFQLRLLWGSRGATVNQSDRFNKFTLILTALSRKLEPPPKTHTQI